MVRVRLIAYTKPVAGDDPQRLPVLAIKVSQGKIREKPPEHYLGIYSIYRVREWLVKAARNFPSVLEHVTFTFLIEGMSRVCSHQLVRHRIASYTQESQRYSDIDIDSVVKKAREALKRIKEYYDDNHIKNRIDEAMSSGDPIEVLRALIDFAGYDQSVVEVAETLFVLPPLPMDVKESIARSYIQSLIKYVELRRIGVSPEEARFVLPQAIKTRIMVTLNLRELLHIACLRLSSEAQWEIREVVKQMIEEAKKVIPSIGEVLEAFCT